MIRINNLGAMPLKRWNTLLLAVWILIAQFMAPLVHAHVGGLQGVATPTTGGLHIHVAPLHLSLIDNHVPLATAIDHVLLDKLSFGIEMPQGVQKGIASVSRHDKSRDKFQPLPFMGLLPTLSVLLTVCISQDLRDVDTPFPQIKEHLSAAAPRAPPALT